MAAQEVTIQNIVRTGLEATYEAAVAGDGHYFVNTGKEFIHIKNAHTSPVTVTIDTPGTVDGHAIGNLSVEITNAEERLIGPFPAALYENANGQVVFTFDVITATTLAVVKLGSLAY